MFYNELPIEQKRILIKINKLKSKLRDTDYQAIKFAEGEMTIAEFSLIKEQRRTWRAQINQLQAELKALKR